MNHDQFCQRLAHQGQGGIGNLADPGSERGVVHLAKLDLADFGGACRVDDRPELSPDDLKPGSQAVVTCNKHVQRPA